MKIIYFLETIAALGLWVAWSFQLNELVKFREYQRSKSFLVIGHSDFKVKTCFLRNNWTIWNQSSHESLRENRNENLYEGVVSHQGSRSPKFGAEIRPHSQSQKVCFFPNSRWKIPNLTRCVWFRKTASVVITYIKNHLKLKKWAFGIDFYIKKHLKFSLWTLNNVHLSSATIVCYRNRVLVCIQNVLGELLPVSMEGEIAWRSVAKQWYLTWLPG